jgi:hypothetical protein
METPAEKEEYRPYKELGFYPGIHLSPERKRELDEDAVEPNELTTDDIVYKLSRMITGTFYGFIRVIEDKWGKEAAREVAFEWGHQRGRENLERWMEARGVKRLTPELLARYQDYRHLISGPLLAPSFTEYEGESDLVLNRSVCLFHDGRPEGMDSYCWVYADGMYLGYKEACPELTCEHPICKSRGTSKDNRCQVRYHIQS